MTKPLGRACRHCWSNSGATSVWTQEDKLVFSTRAAVLCVHRTAREEEASEVVSGEVKQLKGGKRLIRNETLIFILISETLCSEEKPINPL